MSDPHQRAPGCAPSYADRLARTRALVEASQPLPADLADWVIDQLHRPVAADYLRLRRDQHLRLAGEIVGGTINARVVGILREATVLDRCWRVYAQREPEPGTARGAVHRARLIGPIPGRRRLFSILQTSVQSAP